MIVEKDGRHFFKCDGANGACPRVISIDQDAMAAKVTFQGSGWQTVQQRDGTFKNYCADHRRTA
jgi:hypothetical protein